MPTINETVQLAVSSDAIRTLDCFVSSFDTVVYELAEEIAKQRAPGVPLDKLRIEVVDVEQAAESVLRELRKGVEELRFSPELMPIIDSVEERLESTRVKNQ